MSICYSYLHGLQSSPMSRKAQALSSWFAREKHSLHLPDLRQPSLEKLTISAALAELDAMHERVQATHSTPVRWRLVGSSLGGYLAARWAQLNPERVDHLLLLNPALDLHGMVDHAFGAGALERWEKDGALTIQDDQGQPCALHYGFAQDAKTHSNTPEVSCPTRIIQGTQDEVVPPENSRRYASAHAHVDLIEVDDDHRLSDSMPKIASQARLLLEGDFSRQEAEGLDQSNVIFHWDFFGPTAKGTAEHFVHHLKEFIAQRELKSCETGIDSAARTHWAAWCRTGIGQRDIFESTLRPARCSP